MHYWMWDALYDKAKGNLVNAQPYALPDFMHYLLCIIEFQLYLCRGVLKIYHCPTYLAVSPFLADVQVTLEAQSLHIPQTN